LKRKKRGKRKRSKRKKEHEENDKRKKRKEELRKKKRSKQKLQKSKRSRKKTPPAAAEPSSDSVVDDDEYGVQNMEISSYECVVCFGLYQDDLSSTGN